MSTRDTAVATDFYGGPETGVEDAFAEVETEFSQTLARIERGEELSGFADDLRQLVWTLAMRTRALRQHFVKITEGFLGGVVNSMDTSGAQKAMARRVEAHLFETAQREMEGLPPEVRALLAAEISSNTKELTGTLLSHFPLGQLLEEVFAQGSLQEAAEEGHVKGLTKMLAEKKAPVAFSPAHWCLYRVETPVILGDLCIVASDAEGRFGAALESDTFSWETLYLPISSSTFLVASKQNLASPLPPEEINQASAELSSSHIYCSEPTGSIKSLAALIGAKSPFISEQQMSDIIASGWEVEE